MLSSTDIPLESISILLSFTHVYMLHSIVEKLLSLLILQHLVHYFFFLGIGSTPFLAHGFFYSLSHRHCQQWLDCAPFLRWTSHIPFQAKLSRL